VFPDFSQEKTRTWWGEKLKIMLDAGVSGIWNDMNEPANFTGQLPDSVQFADGNHLEMHNVYGHLMAQATAEGLKKANGNRPFVLTRA
jgi:alpha-glucosidase